MTHTTENDDTHLEWLFLQHLKEHHHIDTRVEFSSEFIREHLSGAHTVIPLSIFCNNKLSPLEALVKYLREHEKLGNSTAARMVGRASTATWITYRNAVRKYPKPFFTQPSEYLIPTEVIQTGALSILESVAYHLQTYYKLTYHEIAVLLGRDQRTIWTVCNRARKKLVT